MIHPARPLARFLTGLLVLAGTACGEPLPHTQTGQAPPAAPAAPAPPPPAPAVRERQPANVLGPQGADWLEREGREEEQRPLEVIRIMGLKPGDQVADLGTGTGYFARRIAPVVAPGGTVYAVDIQPEMLEHLERFIAEQKLTNVVPILSTETDPKLPPGSLDWVLLVDVYHELQRPEPMLAKIRESLKPDGRVALIEYRLEGDTAAHISLPHRMSVEQVMAEWIPAGFKLVERHEFLPTQHFFVFRRRG